MRDVVELGRLSVRLREVRSQSLTRHAEIKPKLFSRTLRSRRTSVCTPQSGLCTFSTYPPPGYNSPIGERYIHRTWLSGLEINCSVSPARDSTGFGCQQDRRIFLFLLAVPPPLNHINPLFQSFLSPSYYKSISGATFSFLNFFVLVADKLTHKNQGFLRSFVICSNVFGAQAFCSVG